MFKKDNLKLIVIATVCLVVGLSAPAIGHGVHAQFAHNADKVDGKHAVGAGASTNQRKGKLVATSGTSGRLPNNIIAKAPDADTLDGVDSTGFLRTTAKAADAETLDGKDSTQIGVNGLQRVEASSAESSASPKQVTATCPPGKILVGTGFDIFGGKSGTDPNTRTDVVTDFVIPGNVSVTVAAYEVNGTIANWHVKAIAICAQAP